jgi:hypothetical protein
VAGAGGLRVRGVVHGSVNHLGALSRKTPDARYCNGFPLPSEWAGDVFYGKGTGDRSGLQNLRRTSWMDNKSIYGLQGLMINGANEAIACQH